jgi:DNA-binding GntR family transcriptional regulator
MIPDGLWQHADLELIDIKVWCALCLHGREAGQTTSTNASLAETAETSLATLKRSLSRLAKTGFIQVEGETNKRVIRLHPDAHAATYSLRIAHG